MITQDEAIAMAKEALNQHPPFVMTEVQQLTALCNLVRAKTLEEAAYVLAKDARYIGASSELFRMATGDYPTVSIEKYGRE